MATAYTVELKVSRPNAGAGTAFRMILSSTLFGGCAELVVLLRRRHPVGPDARAVAYSRCAVSGFLSAGVVRVVDRDVVLADGGLVLRAPATVVPQVAQDDLDDAGDGDGEQRAEDAGELDREQDRDQHGERVELHRPGEDHRLQQVVLQLLVQHEE